MTMAVYSRIAEDLMARRRELTSPLRLPAEQELADEHQVGRDTIRRALKVLEDQGAVTRRPGRGTYLQPSVPTTDNLKGKIVGFVPPWWADSTTAWFTSRVFEGVSRWADEHNCHLNVLHAERESPDESAWSAKLEDRDIAGLIWVHPRPQHLPLIDRTARTFPSIVLGRPYLGRGLHHVIPDYARVAELIDQHLVDRGHNQYALLGTSILEAYSQTWLAAIAEARAKRGAGFDYHQHFIDIKAFVRERLAQLILDFYEPNHPDVRAYVLTSSSYLGPLLADARFRDRLTQKQISLMTWDFGLYPMETYWPGHTITHVSCDWARIGHRGMAMLSQLAAGMDVPEVIIDPVSFVEGQTVHSFDRSISSP